MSLSLGHWTWIYINPPPLSLYQDPLNQTNGLLLSIHNIYWNRIYSLSMELYPSAGNTTLPLPPVNTSSLGWRCPQPGSLIAGGWRRDCPWLLSATPTCSTLSTHHISTCIININILIAVVPLSLTGEQLVRQRPSAPQEHGARQRVVMGTTRVDVQRLRQGQPGVDGCERRQRVGERRRWI